MTTPAEERIRWQRVEELFHKALELKCSPEERLAQVRAWIGDDVALAGEVLSLLDSAEAMEDSGSKKAETREIDAWIGREVGGYRVLDLIGRGGMGAVYAAERVTGNESADGRVALKVVGTRLYSPLVIERFQEERRALAALRHPLIAHLLDGGVSESGEPYFVMEFIEGERLDRYCQSRQLKPAAIVELLEQLCEAVAFAHNHGILHGDLKPSNVMVTAEGGLKLLDFGAAMLLPAEGSESGDTTPLAAFTPEYASPERIEGKVCAAAADVYSLGAMLYRLLTGRAPIRMEEGKDGETRTEVRPGVAAAGPETNAAGDENPDADLAAIVHKAMTADPEKRYASMAGLGADLKRYREHRPVEARPVSFAEQTVKFAQRNRRNLAMGLMLALALAAGAVMAIRQTRAARAEEQRARMQMTAVRQLAGFLSTDLYDRLTEVPGSIETQRRVTVQALQYLDGMHKDAAGDFDFETDLARVYIRVGSVQGDPYQPNLGDAQGALQTVKRGREIAAEALRLRPDDLHAVRVAMLAEQTVSEILFGQGDAAAALPYSKKAAELGERVVASKEVTAKDFSDVSGIYSIMGDQYDLQGASSLGDQTAAIAAYRRFIVLNQDALKLDSGSSRAMRAIGIGYQKIGNLLVEQNPSEARPYFVSALDQFDRIPHPSALVLRQRAIMHQKLADCLFFEGNIRGSLAELKIAEKAYVPFVAQDPGNMRVQQTVASIYRDEGESYEALSDWRNAREAYRKVTAILAASLRQDPKNRTWQSHYAETLISLAGTELHMKMKDEAETQEREGIALSLHLAEVADPAPEDLDAAARHLLMAEPTALREPKKALAYAEHANQLVHDAEPDYLLTLARAQRVNGNSQAARKSVEKLLGLHPSKEVRNESKQLLRQLDADKD